MSWRAFPTARPTTYGALAAKVGRPARGARDRHGDEPQPDPDRPALPPHVGANGSLTGYGGGLDRKLQLLQLEGAMLAMTRVVVVGGGFAGLLAVRGLRSADVEVTLVDRQNFHLFQPLAYQVATGALSAAEIAVAAAPDPAAAAERAACCSPR